MKQWERQALVVARVVEWLLPIPEIRGLNPVIGKHYSMYTVLRRQKLRKRGLDWPNSIIRLSKANVQILLHIRVGAFPSSRQVSFNAKLYLSSLKLGDLLCLV